MAKYRYLGHAWNLDGKTYRYGDTLTLSNEQARSLMDHHHALEPVDDGVQPFVTGTSDIQVAGVVDEAGEPVKAKK